MDPWNLRDGQQQQFITREQFEQLQQQHLQQIQQAHEQLEIQQQQL